MANGGTCYVGGVANTAGQAACQAQPGATWVPDAPEQQQSTSNPWGTAFNVGLGLASIHPIFRLGSMGVKGAQALYKGLPMKGRIGGLMDKLLRRDKSVNHPSWKSEHKGVPIFGPKITTTSRALSPVKMGYAGGGTVLAGIGYQGK